MADPLDRLGVVAIPEEQRALKQRRLLAAFAIPTVGCALLVHNARGTTTGMEPAAELQSRLEGFRGWDDVAIAAAHFVSGDYPVAAYEITNRNRRDRPDFLAFRDVLLRELRLARIRPQQFWRTLDSGAFRDDQRILARRWDDPGRQLLLALCFSTLGGVAPFLLGWLGVLAALPVMAWLGYQLAAAGRAVAGAVLLALLACSGFVVDVLMLSYSATGFSLLALLLVAAMTVYACWGRPTIQGLLARALCAGIAFGWLVAARSGSLLSLAGMSAALLAASWRALPQHEAGGRERHSARAGLAAAALILYIAPYAVPRLLHERWLEETLARMHISRKPKAVHDVWVTLWQGLGDFDRAKGHTFLDKAGELEARRHGSPLRLSESSEALFRGLLLRDIREDPTWYAAILARRTWATLTLEKLWPWAPRDGRALAPAIHPAEGVTDSYWGMTLSADFFRFGRRTWEAPMSLLLLPPLGLAAVGLFARDPLRDGARRGLGVTACVALAALPAPVLISTAAAFEVESFVVVHFTAAAFCAQAVWDALRPATAARAGSGR